MDKIVFDLISEERARQMRGIELIASENFVSDQVMQAMGSVLTNKYAEGYPGKRYYGGCQIVDQVEDLAIERLCKLFKSLCGINGYTQIKAPHKKKLIAELFSEFCRNSCPAFCVNGDETISIKHSRVPLSRIYPLYFYEMSKHLIIRTVLIAFVFFKSFVS